MWVAHEHTVNGGGQIPPEIQEGGDATRVALPPSNLGEAHVLVGGDQLLHDPCKAGRHGLDAQQDREHGSGPMPTKHCPGCVHDALGPGTKQTRLKKNEQCESRD